MISFFQRLFGGGAKPAAAPTPTSRRKGVRAWIGRMEKPQKFNPMHGI